MTTLRHVLLCVLTAAASLLGAIASAAEPSLPSLRVSENDRFLVTDQGEPFFYLADTAWELIHRLDREQIARYLDDRKAKGFTVIQTVVLAEHGGLTEPNPQGHLPLEDAKDPTTPFVREGADNDYWDDVDAVVDMAAERGLYVGLLPTWGRYVTSHWANGIVDGIFTPANARTYGRFIGQRYRDRSNIIWIIGGDRAAPTPESQAIWRAMAEGVTIGVAGRLDHDAVLMTYHTSGPGHASDFFHDDPWLDFTTIQSSHGDRILNWKMIDRDWERRPPKPIIDLETTYPGLVIIKGMKQGNDDHARRSAYWAVFAGACGHTYGHNSIWQMYAPGRRSILEANSYWYEALDAPSGRQIGYLRDLMLSRPVLSRRPAQQLLTSAPGDSIDHVRATSGDGYAMIYSPLGAVFEVDTDALGAARIIAWWFNPRDGTAQRLDTFATDGPRRFDPPGDAVVGNDWVLVLDDAERQFASPGR